MSTIAKAMARESRVSRKPKRKNGLRNKEGQHDEGAADQQAGRHVDVHDQFSLDVETFDDLFQDPRDDDHFNQAGQPSRNVDMVVPSQKRHQGCRQDEKGRLQCEQVDTGGEPPLRHDGEAG